MADLHITKIYNHAFTNRDGYDATCGITGIAIEFHNGGNIVFKEGVTKEKALEIVELISDVDKEKR